MSTLSSLFARALLALAGIGFLVGFFLPWFRLGTTASVSGLGLLVTDGEIVELVTGPDRILLFAVPLLGVGVTVGAIAGHRIGVWLALIAGVLVLGGGLYTLINLFVSTTGPGMWLVVASALTSLVVGVLALASRTPK